MLLDPVEPVRMPVNGNGHDLHIFAQRIEASRLTFDRIHKRVDTLGLAYDGLGKTANLSLHFLVARGDFGAHVLQKAKSMIVNNFRYVQSYIGV
jgi:hypothetical protein